MEIQWKYLPFYKGYFGACEGFQADCTFGSWNDVDSFTLHRVHNSGKIVPIVKAAQCGHSKRKQNVVQILDDIMEVLHYTLKNLEHPPHTFRLAREFWESHEYDLKFKNEETYENTIGNLQVAAQFIISLVKEI